MGAHVGRDVVVEFSIAAEDAVEGTLVWKTLGMMRGKSIKTSWDTADTTADSSADATKEALATFRNVEFSGDGVSRDEAIYNQEELEAHVANPSTTGGQPKAWFRLTYPSGKKYSGPYLISEWSNDSPYADASTWSIAATSNGAITFTPAP